MGKLIIIAAAIINLSLEGLLKEAEQNNPEILSSKNEYEAYALRVNPANFPPDPVLFLSGKTAMREFGVFIEQNIPAPKKLSALAEITNNEALLKLEKIKDIKITVLSEVSKEYFEYSYLNNVLEIHKEVKDIYENMSKIVAANYSTGKASLAELSRILSKIAQTQTEINRIQGEIESVRAKISYLVGKDVMIEKLNTLPYPKDTRIIHIAEAELENAPKIKIAKIEKEIKQSEKNLAKTEYYPDLSVRIGGTYSRDFGAGVEVMFGLSIPVYSRWKQSQIVLSKTLEEKAYENLLEKTILETKSLLKEKASTLIYSFENIKLYQEALDHAYVSVKSTLSQWTTGKITLTDSLSAITEYLEIKIGLEKEKNEYWKAFSEIIRISGLDPLKTFKEVGIQ